MRIISSYLLPRSFSVNQEPITPCRRWISCKTSLTFVSTRPLKAGSLSLSSATFSFLTMFRVFVMTERCVAMAAWISPWRLSARVLNRCLKLVCSDSKTLSSRSLLVIMFFRLLSLPLPVALSVCQSDRKNSCAILNYHVLRCMHDKILPWVRPWRSFGCQRVRLSSMC